MITTDELAALLRTGETYRVERTVSTTDMDKFQEAICAFANDLPGTRKPGYLLIGVKDKGQLSGLRVTDQLMTKIAAIRSDGNILPLPTMAVEKFTFVEGDVLVVEVQPSVLPPHRYRGRTFIRIGPRRDVASEAEERILTERRTAYMATFDAMPCLAATLDDLDLHCIRSMYLPAVVDPDILRKDHRTLKEQLSATHLYDATHDCPTNAAVLLFGRDPEYFMPGAYVQYVRFRGKTTGGDILNEKRLSGCLCRLLPRLDSFISDLIITQRPVPVSILREKAVFNFPDKAIRELMMNACMHRDYQSHMPIRLYRYDDRIEVMNAGGLYGEARPENFPQVNDYRNPLVAKAMRAMKYVNMFNHGVSRVRELFLQNGNPAPEFNVDKLTVFEVVGYPVRTSGTVKPYAPLVDEPLQTINEPANEPLKKPLKPRNEPLKNGNEPLKPRNEPLNEPLKNNDEPLNKPLKPQNEPLNEPLNERQRTILSAVSNNPSVTKQALAAMCKVSLATLKRDMEALQARGTLRRIGSRKVGEWKITKSIN